MKRIYGYLSLMIASLCGVSCMEETRLDLPVQEDERVELSFNLRVADAEIHSPQTRSPFVSDEATQEESEIHNIWVLQFADTTSDAALREARYYASAEDLAVIKLIASSTPTRVVVVANTFDPDIAFGHCEDMAEFIGAYKRVSSEADVSFFRAGKYCPPLSAYLDLDKLNVSGGTLDFLLKRIVAKADLTITNATTGPQAVTITSVTVCNVPDKLYFFSSYHLPELFPPKWNDDRVDFPLSDWSEGSGSGDTRSYTFYLPVNKCGSIPAHTNPAMGKLYAPGGASYLCVKGTYPDPSDPTMLRPVEYKLLLGADENDCNILPNAKYSFNLTINDRGDNYSDAKAENASLVDFCPKERANSYIINPPQVDGTWLNYRIPVEKVYTFWNSREGYYDRDDYALLPGCLGWHVEIIWSEMPIDYGTNFKWIKDEGTDYKDYFEFALPSSFEHGNILVGIRPFIDDQGTTGPVFLWSWQLWVTDYNPDPALHYTPKVDAEGNELQFAYSVEHGDVQRLNHASWKTGLYKDSFIMDRNLGAIGAGGYVSKAKGQLYYVFGRKDPFRQNQDIYPGPAGLTYGVKSAGSTGEVDNVIYAINHPNIYINGVSLWADLPWQRNDAYAATGLVFGDPKVRNMQKKSIFDPCPPGWRVPAKDVFDTKLNNSLSESTYRYYDLTPDIRLILPLSGCLLSDRNGWGEPASVYFWFVDGTLAYPSSTFNTTAPGKRIRCVSDNAFD